MHHTTTTITLSETVLHGRTYVKQAVAYSGSRYLPFITWPYYNILQPTLKLLHTTVRKVLGSLSGLVVVWVFLKKCLRVFLQWLVVVPCKIVFEFLLVLGKLIADFVCFPLNVLLYFVARTSVHEIYHTLWQNDKRDYLIILELCKTFLFHWGALCLLGCMIGMVQSLVMFKILNKIVDFNFLKINFKIDLKLKLISLKNFIGSKITSVKNFSMNLIGRGDTDAKIEKEEEEEEEEETNKPSITKINGRRDDKNTDVVVYVPAQENVKTNSKKTKQKKSRPSSSSSSIGSSTSISSVKSFTMDDAIKLRRKSSNAEELASHLPDNFFQQLRTPMNSDTEEENEHTLSREKDYKTATLDFKVNHNTKKHNNNSDEKEEKEEDEKEEDESVFSSADEGLGTLKQDFGDGSVSTTTGSSLNHIKHSNKHLQSRKKP